LVDMYVLYSHLLLAFAAMAIERVEQHDIGPGKLVRLAQALAARMSVRRS
jgi:hypothetical protein